MVINPRVEMMPTEEKSRTHFTTLSQKSSLGIRKILFLQKEIQWS